MNEQELFKILGVNVKAQRARYGWSQAELAERANISINFLSDVETGKKWISPVTMLKLAGVFGLEVYELLKPPGNTASDSLKLLVKYNKDACYLLNQLQRKYLVQLGRKNQLKKFGN